MKFLYCETLVHTSGSPVKSVTMRPINFRSCLKITGPVKKNLINQYDHFTIITKQFPFITKFE